MKRLIAIILGIALISPAPAQANGNTYQILTPVLTTTYELPAQTWNSRWSEIEIPFEVFLVSDGTVASFHFDLIDGQGYKIAEEENSSPNNWDIEKHKQPVSWRQTNKWNLYRFDKAVLPISLRVTIEFWRSEGKPDIVQTFPMKFVTHKDDIAEVEKAKAEAQAQATAIAEAKAKAEAEAKAAILKAQAEAEAKVKAEAEAKARIEAEIKAKQEAEAKAKAQAEKILAEQQYFAKSLYTGTRCKKRYKVMTISEVTFICTKKGKKLSWQVSN